MVLGSASSLVGWPDFGRVGDFFSLQIYGVPIITLGAFVAVVVALAVYFLRSGSKTNKTVIQDDKSKLGSPQQFIKETEGLDQGSLVTELPSAEGMEAGARIPVPPLQTTVMPRQTNEGYCVRCKATREIAKAQETTMPNGKRTLKGNCAVCGTKMNKFLPGSNGHDISSRLVDAAVRRIENAPIVGGKFSVVYDDVAKAARIEGLRVDFDLGANVTQGEHDAAMAVLQAKLDEVSTQLASIANTQNRKAEEEQ